MGGFEPKVVAPIVFVGVGALFVLLGEISTARGSGRRGHVLLAGIAAASLALAAYAAWATFTEGTIAYFDPRHRVLRLDPYSSYVATIVALASLLTVGLSVVFLRVLDIAHGEFYALLLLATAGMLALVSAVDMIAIFVGLELATLPVAVLTAFDRGRLRSNEAGLKLVILGGFASALLLYGMALLYGAAGTTKLAGIAAVFDSEDRMMMIGFALVFVGFAFKIGAVPFHQWLPDVYEGAPTIVTAFLTVATTTAALAVFLRFAAETLAGASLPLVRVVWGLAAASLLLGSLMALIQSDLKRLFAYSTIGHSGNLLLGLAVGTPEAHAALLLYLPAFVFANLGAFGVLISLAQGGRECTRFEDLYGLARERPGLAAAMTLFVVSLVGIPGTVGFVAKFHLYLAAVSAGYVVLTMIALATTAVVFYAHWQFAVAMYMREPERQRLPRVVGSHMGLGEQLVLTACAAAVLLFGVLPDNRWLPILDWAETAARGLGVE